MACVSLNITNGPFDPITPWSTALNQSQGGITVERDTAGPSPGITVTGPGGSIFHQTLGTNLSKYLMFGTSNHVLILESGSGAGPVNRNVTIVDFTGGSPSEQSIFLSSSSSTGVNEPVVHKSPGNGKAFLIWSSSGTQIQNLSIRRSDNGDVICAGPPPFIATGITHAEASATELIINYSSGGMSYTSVCPKPLGECAISPSSHTFPDAVIGPGVPAALTTTSETFTIENDGDDCLNINSIANASPFAVTSTSESLPANLSPGDSMTVDVTFAPGAIGNFGPTNLPVSRTPANGDSNLVCEGEAREPVIAIGFSSASLAWGKTSIGSSPSKTLTISNNGEIPIDVNIAANAGFFSWPAVSITIPVGGNHPHNISFSPIAEIPYSDAISIISDDPGSPDNINLTGEGCIANSTISVPPIAPINFGEIQQGFRTVRIIKILNIGDGPLSFTARIQGVDQTFFGLQPPSGSLYDLEIQRNYNVDPATACGSIPTGDNETIIAVSFFADDSPALKSAELFIFNHNDPNNPISNWIFPLSAEIVPPIAVDAAQVFDRSGSMADPSGDRFKFEAEIAAGKLFSELARPDILDRITLVKFNKDPNTFQPIIDITSGNQPGITASINSVELDPDGATNIAGGVILGLNELAIPRPTTPPLLNKVMIVLTDGQDNRAYLNPADNTWYTLMGGPSKKPDNSNIDETEALPVPSDVRIYSVGLGNEENIDKGQLDLLSQATGAYYGIVGDLSGEQYFSLEKYFTQIYMDAIDMAVIEDPVYNIMPGDKHEIEFDLLRGDVGSLVVIFDHKGIRLPFYLRSPKGELIDMNTVPPGFQIRPGFTDTARFIEFRVPQGEPERYEDRWKVVIEHPGTVCFDIVTNASTQGYSKQSFYEYQKCKDWDKPVKYGIAIGANSNFRMQAYVTPGVVKTGEPILLSSVITEADLRVTGCNVTVHAVSPSGASWDLNLYDDGVHNDADINDGEYARFFTNTAESGSYEFTFRATGYTRDNKPVKREAVRGKYVEGRQPLIPDPQKPSRGSKKCCKTITYLLVILILILIYSIIN